MGNGSKNGTRAVLMVGNQVVREFTAPSVEVVRAFVPAVPTRFEMEEAARILPEAMRSEWLLSSERRRWNWLDHAIRQTPHLTSDERDERLEQYGGLHLATCARERALLDFRSRIELEKRNRAEDAK